jgi:serralysin
MTYRSYPGQDLADGGGYTNETFGYPQTLMMLDIAALQKIYGAANYAFNSTDSVYTWSSITGETFINGVGQGGAGANRVFQTVWDGGGNDTYDLSNHGSAVTIDLRPGEWTTTSAVQLANLGSGNFARGNIANALLYYGDTSSLIENGIGGSAGDTLIANQAVNRLTGNGGGDTFRWMAASDSKIGAADTIADFQSGADHIDLSSLDADTRSQANDAFHWIGSAAFSGAAGELRGEVIAGSLHIFADVNADAVADFEIILANHTAIATSDFIF